jgi:hypothetical protein
MLYDRTGTFHVRAHQKEFGVSMIIITILIAGIISSDRSD